MGIVLQRVDKRRAICAAAGLLLLAGAPTTGAAAEPSITVLDSEAATKYQTYVEQLVSEIISDAAPAEQDTSDGPAIYADLNSSLDQVPGFDSFSAADRALLEATKRTYDLYRALGGVVIDRFVVLQRQDNRFYVGLDGEGGRWVATVEEALTVLLEQLTEFRIFRLSSESAATQCPFDFRCLLLAAYTGTVDTIAYAPRGTTVTLEMAGEGFRGEGGPPVVLAPDEFIVHEVTFENSETIRARVSIVETAPLAVSVFGVYNEGNAFRSVQRYGVRVVASAEELAAFLNDADSGEVTTDEPQAIAGSGEVERLTDDHSSDRGSATALSGAASGRLVSGDDADLFKIVVDQAGTLTVNSAGPTDLTGTLETAEGAVIATDDDGGPWYNFRIEKSVSPGTYYLRVTHCCAGAGQYRLSSRLVPD